MNQEDLVQLKHNIGMLRIAFNANEEVNEIYASEDDIYKRGLKQGYKQANDNYKKYINRLEKLLEGVNIYD